MCRWTNVENQQSIINPASGPDFVIVILYISFFIIFVTVESVALSTYEDVVEKLVGGEEVHVVVDTRICGVTGDAILVSGE